MNIRPRVAVVTASLALAGGAVAGFAAPASASVVEAAATPAATVPSATGGSGFTCATWRYLRGDIGHGASITCYGKSFTSYVVCHRADGIDYLRFGDRVRSGRTSTAWCDLNGEVIDAGAIPG
ncbi:hypothetical protein J7W19_19090 [Streptomyces mobaraensis NBRC 13819 = DSM 40847]|uniref:Secreted protein n=2 Tax=Streptomyces mobaraensis TaxID=35621 RepID=A0A5N5WF66_STRMB|nr:hypothetical protein [Streptomyces mobaraensis]EME99833.1 hypothetical protein H340_14371 [Streptomyces mobaraensis NBRC 13819 = DSM 40847]KAB7852680.1 hypothetical protein FRZ00_00235 [Streptomyces mobaraensis]QTT75198.1 hypothetical protein J7W19_19090 [Streptomyces mobaraensis NBRC 13819 = DSM 40847]